MNSLRIAWKIAKLHPLAAFTCLCLAILLLDYWQIIFCQVTFLGSDHQRYFEPFAKFIGAAWRHFHWPMWNPYIHCGMPQVAVPSPGLFYPPNLLFAFLPYGQALAWLMIFHQLLAAIGAYLLISSFGWGRAAACTAGLIAGFSGYMFSLTANYTLVTTSAWIPINFWALRSIRLCQNNRKKYLLTSLSATVAFMLIAAGRPEVGLPAAGLIGCFAWLQSFPRTNKPLESSNNNFRWQCFALFIGALLAMPVILPTFEWLKHSPRAHGMDIEYVFMWSANWYDILCMVFAQPFGDLMQLGSPYLSLAASRPGHLPFLASTLVGPIALSLAIWGISDRNWRGRNWTLVVFIFSLIMVLGHNASFLSQFIARIPCVNIFRYPIKLIIFSILCIALAAARGMWCVSTKNVSRRMLLFVVILWAVAFFIGLCFATAGLLNKPLPVQGLAAFADAQLLLGESIMHGSFLGLLTCGITYLLRQSRVDRTATIAVLVCFLAGSLILPALCYRANTAAADYYSHRPYLLSQLESLTPSPEKLNQQRILPLYFDPVKIPEQYSCSKGSSQSLNYYQYCSDLLLPNTNIDWAQPETFGYEAAETKDFQELIFNCFRKIPSRASAINSTHANDWTNRNQTLWQFCRTSTTTWLCTQIDNDAGPVAKFDSKYFQLVKEAADMNVRFYRVKDGLQRAYICRNWHWADSHEAALNKIRDPQSSGFDPQINALIEHLPASSSSYAASMPPPQTDKATMLPTSKQDLHNEPIFTQQGVLYPATNVPDIPAALQSPVFLQDFPEHLSISVNLNVPSFLILADQFYPGWIAHIDSVPTPIFRANGVFRAVYVPKGGHLIQFDYEPDSLKIGLYLSAAGLILLLSMLWLAALPTIWRWLKLMAGEV